ncbi:MAG: membrane dipeptidase [Symbiobacteriia bacterium]
MCPSTRNLTDRQLDAIRDSDGLVGMNFEVCAVRRTEMTSPTRPSTRSCMQGTQDFRRY